MRRLFLCMFVLLPLFGFTQIIECLPESILLESGVVMSGVHITNADGDYVDFIKDGEALRLQKSMIKKWTTHPCADAPLPVNEEGRYEIQNVVNVPDASAAKIYSAAKLWIADTFGDAKHAIEMDDQESHVVVLNGNTEISSETKNGRYLMAMLFKFNIKIEAKDGRYRYTISKLEVDIPSSFFMVDGYLEGTFMANNADRDYIKDGYRQNLIYKLNALSRSLDSMYKDIKSNDDW